MSDIVRLTSPCMMIAWFLDSTALSNPQCTACAVVSNSDPFFAPASEFPRLQSVGTSKERLAGWRPLDPASRWRLDVGATDRCTRHGTHLHRLKSRRRATTCAALHGTAHRWRPPLVICTINTGLLQPFAISSLPYSPSKINQLVNNSKTRCHLNGT